MKRKTILIVAALVGGVFLLGRSARAANLGGAGLPSELDVLDVDAFELALAEIEAHGGPQNIASVDGDEFGVTIRFINGTATTVLNTIDVTPDASVRGAY